MRKFMTQIRKRTGNQKGVTNMLVLLIVMPSFLFITLMVIVFATFLLRQAKIDDIKARALQMIQTEGYLTTTIMNDTRTKLANVGFPIVNKGGVTYPSFTGSTTTKVLKDDADPTIQLVIQYPASDLSRLMALLGVTKIEDPGYFLLEGNGRSEKYD